MAQLQTKALILRATPYSETSQVVRLLTAEGVLNALARGTAKRHNRFQGPIEPHVIAECSIAMRKDFHALHTLMSARQVGWFGALRSSLVLFGAAECIREILLSTPVPDADAPYYLDLATTALSALGQPPRALPVVTRFCAAWINHNGLTPELTHCVETDREASGRSAVVLSYREFGLLARRDAMERPDTQKISAAALRLLWRIFELKDSGERDFALPLWQEAFIVCRRLVELSLGREIRSAKFLTEEVARHSRSRRKSA